jgi:ribose/xylose/arabinose/galactoside ABC-type transport system permease subunit
MNSFLFDTAASNAVSPVPTIDFDLDALLGGAIWDLHVIVPALAFVALAVIAIAWLTTAPSGRSVGANSRRDPAPHFAAAE